MNGPDFFWMDTEGGEPGDGAWFWSDDNCEEAMGPFESRADAEADYRELRKQTSNDGAK